MHPNKALIDWELRNARVVAVDYWLILLFAMSETLARGIEQAMIRAGWIVL